jgi:hypothetical protein
MQADKEGQFSLNATETAHNSSCRNRFRSRPTDELLTEELRCVEFCCRENAFEFGFVG